MTEHEKKLDLSDFGGGSVLLYHECHNSDEVEEIFMTISDFESQDVRGTVIMEPRHARQLAQMLLEIADLTEHWNDDEV